MKRRRGPEFFIFDVLGRAWPDSYKVLVAGHVCVVLNLFKRLFADALDQRRPLSDAECSLGQARLMRNNQTAPS